MEKLKKIWNEKTERITKTDYIILGVILLFYSVLSFVNLGSITNPQTFYTFKQEESIIFKFSDITKIDQIKLYNGEINSSYYLYISQDGNKYTYIKDIKGNGAFAWNEETIQKNVQYIKLTAKTENATIGEIGFYTNENKLIKPFKVESSIINKDKKAKALIDEATAIPEKINYLNSSYFDEIYFARTAYEYANGLEAYEWVHPPLGKLIQAIPIKLTNTMAPFTYRLMGNLAGIIMILVMYVFAKKLFKSRKLAILSALLMTFDTFHFAQTRMGTVDSFLVLFIISSYYYMYQYMTTQKTKNLLFSGLFFGLATAVKWTGLFAGLGLAIIFFIHIIKHKKISIKLLGKCTIFYVLIPAIIYISSYLFFPKVQVTTTDSLKDIKNQTIQMYNYHSKLEATHPFSSEWYTWPFSYKPVWYYQGEITATSKGTISGIGNIAIWWLGIIAFLYTIIQLIRRKEKESLLLIVGALTLWLPYIFIGRCMFLYHYFPVLPFVMLSIVYLFKDITSKKWGNIVLPLYIGIIILTFILYYPMISGLPVPNTYINAFKVLKSWIF